MSNEPKWAEVPGWPAYRVSTNGRVQSRVDKSGLLRDEWHEIAPVYNADGYHKVTLHRKNKRFMIGVHELVLICHGPKRPPGRSCALHGNGIRDDNRLENLRWGFDDDNVRDRDLHGTTVKGEKHPKCKLTEANVIDMRRRHAAGVRAATLAREYGMHQSTVSGILRGEKWRHVKMP